MAKYRWKMRATETIKFLSYPVVFLIVLGSSAIAKGSILLMTSQLRTNKTALHCHRLLGEDEILVVTPEKDKIAWIWCLIFAFAVPEMLTLIQNINTASLKSMKLPTIENVLLVALIESFHVVGAAIMFMIILPDLDVIQGAMLTSCVCFVPALIGLLPQDKKLNKSMGYNFVLVSAVILTAQTSAYVFWPLLNISSPSIWLIPVSLILISCKWWKNYVSIHSPLYLLGSSGQVEEDARLSKNFTQILVSIWKIITFVLCSVLILHFRSNTDFTYLFTMFGSACSDRNVTFSEIQSMVFEKEMTGIIATDFTSPRYVLVVQILSAYSAHVFGKLASKISIQRSSCTLAVNLAIPVLISLLTATCNLRNDGICAPHGINPDYLFLELYPLSVFGVSNFTMNTWIWMLLLFAQAWITTHIFTRKCEHPESMENLFVAPYYSGLLINQPIGASRKRDDQPSKDSKECTKEADGGDNKSSLSSILKSDLVTKIYACVTMWHETKGEMTECLKSILRLDKNQCAMKSDQECSKKVIPDFYELETHIFFDDAYKESEHNKTEVEVNEWVKQFVQLLDEIAFQETGVLIKPMKKCTTPYGGRLVWILPGNTKLFVHLKDANRIRHRKRWSQVMYMYYLLGHRIESLATSKDRRKAIAENTYLLALDGDIVFQPSAVKILVDLMKKDKNLGVACGRIHPLGSGPIVWYQMFEYAIGHWLQKPAEQTIGSVLCSPGCFSLFRAEALMDDSVMEKYTSKSSEARHYVQYDQGEDRWLCTLLLKKGYKVGYSAACDAWTHVPEGFNEFYNQRRRWVPSTMANVIDLLMDHRRVVEKNINISRLYMLYQLFLLGSTILSPGTIFLMLVGAFNATFHIGIWQSFYLNFALILVFTIVCLTCDSKVQLSVAAMISVIYGLIMIAVTMENFMEVFEDRRALMDMFSIMLVGEITLAAIFHPRELKCLPYGVIFYLAVPSMHMLLTIYSIANLNDVTWGTRVGKPSRTSQESSEEEKPQGSKQMIKENFLLDFDRNDQSYMKFSFTELFRIILSTHYTSSRIEHRLNAVKNLWEKLKRRFDDLGRPADPEKHGSGHSRVSLTESHTPHDSTPRENSDSVASMSQNTENDQEHTFLENIYWLKGEALKKGEVDALSAREQLFWDDIIIKYLAPIYEKKGEKASVAADLRDFRNKSFISFFILNALFVALLFFMQLNREVLHSEWPSSSETNISSSRNSSREHIVSNYLDTEPINLVFVIFSGIVFAIQFLAMLYYRLSTLGSILPNTSYQDLGYYGRKPEKLS